MKRISIYLMMLLLCAASCNKDNANGAAEGTNSGTVDPKPEPEPQPEDGEPAEIDFNNIDLTRIIRPRGAPQRRFPETG